MASKLRTPLALIVGSGPGISHSLGKVFYKAGYSVLLSRRSEDKLEEDVQSLKQNKDLQLKTDQIIKGYPCDASKEAQVISLFDSIEKEFSSEHLKVVIFNAGSFSMGSILTETEDAFRRVWESSALGSFLVGRQAARVFVKNIEQNKDNLGTILFTGASASLRGKAKFTAFGSAKAGIRSVSQSLARELGPKGIHVGHVVVDGAVDNIKENRKASDPTKNVMDPDAIADSYLFLVNQPKSAWTHELDIRTNEENW